ncbi:MAG: UbiD family decarboxylase [Phycisphaerales bacterium]
MYPTLQDLLTALDAAGELRRVSTPVSPILEISEITDRVSKSPSPNPASTYAQRTDPRFHHLGGHALLFENVRHSDFPVAINTFGSYRRTEMALGCPSGKGFDHWAERLRALVEPVPPSGIREAIEKIRQFAPVLKMPPKPVKTGICQELVWTGKDADVTRLPLLRCWPQDGDLRAVGWPSDINRGIEGIDLDGDPAWRGRYITFAGIHTIHADDAGAERPRSRNIGMYRVQAMGRKRLAMHWHMHHDGARHWRSWKKRGERMPVAIVFGGESVLPYAATAPMPPGLSEILLAGLLNGRGIPLCPCKTVPLRVPAHAEIVIEGWVSHEAHGVNFDPHSGEPLGPGAVAEGPFGDHTGFYSLPDRYPIVEVTAITMRRNAVFPATIVGLPPQEDYYLGKATERLFLPLLQTLIPDIEDYDLPMFGAFHNCAFLKIRKEYPLQGRRVMHSVWGAGQMAWTKHIVVVDEHVDVHDHASVLRAMGARCDPVRDVERVTGPLDILDHAAPMLGMGTKMGFDATEKTADEKALPPGKRDKTREGNDVLARARGVPGVLGASMPAPLGGAWLFVRAEEGRGREVIGALDGAGALARWTVVVSGEVDVEDWDACLFRWCANSDPGRDRHVSKDGSCVAFDATSKRPAKASESTHRYPVRPYPEILKMDNETESLVTRRWEEYGIE